MVFGGQEASIKAMNFLKVDHSQARSADRTFFFTCSQGADHRLLRRYDLNVVGISHIFPEAERRLEMLFFSHPKNQSWDLKTGGDWRSKRNLLYSVKPLYRRVQ